LEEIFVEKVEDICGILMRQNVRECCKVCGGDICGKSGDFWGDKVGDLVGDILGVGGRG
jgi:hypothetical protein